MKDPQHPPGPAFGQASDAAEAARQQLIAALSAQQRAAFEALRNQQDQKEKAQRQAQDRAQREQVAERMRKHLLAGKELRYEHPAHRHKLKRPQDLHHAVEDHLAGRETAVTREYRRQLAIAHTKAKNDVARQRKQDRMNLQAAHRRARDDFLKGAARQRSRQGLISEFRDNAARPAHDAQPARDQSWQRAFEKAARKESDRVPEHERDLSDRAGKSR